MTGAWEDPYQWGIDTFLLQSGADSEFHSDVLFIHSLTQPCSVSACFMSGTVPPNTETSGPGLAPWCSVCWAVRLADSPWPFTVVSGLMETWSSCGGGQCGAPSLPGGARRDFTGSWRSHSRLTVVTARSPCPGFSHWLGWLAYWACFSVSCRESQ